MASENRVSHPLEAGIYIIQSVLSGTSINLIAREAGEEPQACIWKTTQSPTQLWHVEPTKNGYHLKNPSTNRYLSHPAGVTKNWTCITGTKRPAEWLIKRVHDHFVVKPFSKQDVGLDVSGWDTRDGTQLIFYEFHGKTNQQWHFQKVDDEKPPAYSNQNYIGPIPTGVYWLGQPQEATSPSLARKSPSASALTVAARLPLKGDATALAHLTAIGSDGLWPSQIWVIEPGRRGFKLKNLATDAYLNYINRQPVMEPASNEGSGVTEWALEKDPGGDKNAVPNWWIHPTSDHDVILTIRKGNRFNELCVMSLPEYKLDWGKDWGYGRWRFEVVDEENLVGASGPTCIIC